MPSFKEVLDVVADDMVIEKCIIASEIEAGNPQMEQYLTNKFADIEVERVTEFFLIFWKKYSNVNWTSNNTY